MIIAFIQEVISIPSITDWLQAIGTIAGVPGAIVAFILLFKKDKEKQLQIDMLTNLVIEMNKQTQQFEYQTILMRESNDILKEQAQINNEVFIKDKEYKEKMEKLELRKIKLQIKPYLKFQYGSYFNNILKANFLNQGGSAKFTNYNIPVEDELIIKTLTNITVNRNEEFELTAHYVGNQDLKKIDKMVEIEYEDSMENKYKQNIIIRGNSFKILDPVEVLK